jgi:hypothetical protein
MKEKPADIVINEVKKSISDVIFQSRLPLSVVSMILGEAKISVDNQLMAAMQKYYAEKKAEEPQPQA